MPHHPLTRSAVLTVAAAAAVIGVGSCSTAAADQPTSVAWDHAPQEYRQAIDSAVSEYGCTGISRDIIAAQMYTGSRFQAVESPSGARGPAQLIPSQWDKYAPTVKATDINSPVDSSNVLVAVNCDNVQELRAGGIDPTLNNVMEAYVAGPRAVINPIPQHYKDIRANVAPLLDAARPA